MSASIPLSRAYHRPVAISTLVPPRGTLVGEAARHCSAMAGAGRYHFARWLATDDVTLDPATSLKQCRTTIRPGPAAAYLYVSLIVQPASPPSGASMIEFLGDGDSTYNGSYRQVPGGRSSAVPEAAALQEIVYEYDVSASQDSLLEVWWSTDTVHLLKSICCWDSPLPLLTDADAGYIDLTQFGAGKPITTTAMAGVVALQKTVAADLRLCVMAGGPLLDSGGTGVYQRAVDSSWKNIATGTAGYDDTEPGIWYRPSATWGKTAADCKLSIRIMAAMTAAGGVDALVRLRYNDGVDDFDSTEMTVTGTTLTEYTATMTNLDAPAAWVATDRDLLLQLLVKEGSTPGGTVDIHSVFIEETDT